MIVYSAWYLWTAINLRTDMEEFRNGSLLISRLCIRGLKMFEGGRSHMRFQVWSYGCVVAEMAQSSAVLTLTLASACSNKALGRPLLSGIDAEETNTSCKTLRFSDG